MKTQFEHLLIDVKHQICQITMNRPKVLNALNTTMRAEISEAISEAGADPEVKVIILTGAGRSFTVGVDLAASAHRPVDGDTAAYWRNAARKFVAETTQIWDLPKPVIAAVNGYALAAGCDLALICDITLASESAVFGEPEIRHISSPPTLIMPYVIGWKRAKELLLTGDSVNAQEALALGLVNKVYPDDQLMAEAWKLAARMAKIDSFSLETNKHAINRTVEIAGLKEALNYNADLSVITHLSEPYEVRVERKRIIREEGLKAFVRHRDQPFQE